MLKLLIYGVLVYFGYRFFIKPLVDPPKDLPRHHDSDRIDKDGTRFGEEEGDFIDYEEVE